MIAIVRIKGLIGIRAKTAEMLFRLKLRKKYACVVLRENPDVLKMLKKLENFTAYGRINEEALAEIIEKRGKALAGKKIDAKKIASEFLNSKTEKRFSEIGIKDFFRLHPPRGGIKSSKMHYPKGVLGNNKENIMLLVRRML